MGVGLAQSGANTAENALALRAGGGTRDAVALNMGEVFEFERRLAVFVSSLALAVACGGSATENGGNASAGASNGGSGGESACEQAKESYLAQAVTATSSADATACTSDDDCATLSVSECGDYCTVWVVNTASKASVTSKLETWAAANCSTCRFEMPPCVSNDLSPVCVSGTCRQYHPL
jgi:hypothetical protein